jgi:hypothetical protein
MRQQSGPIRVVHNPASPPEPNFPFGRNVLVVQSGSLGSLTSPPTDALVITSSTNATPTSILTLNNPGMANPVQLNFPDVSNSVTVNSFSGNSGILAAYTLNGYPVGTGFFSLPYTNNVTAHAGGGQLLAVRITTSVVNVTNVTTANDSIQLPPAVAGLQITVLNSGANTVAVWVANGSTDQVSGASVVGLTAGSTGIITCYKSAPGGIWNLK